MSTILFIENDTALVSTINELVRTHLHTVSLLLHADNEEQALSLCQEYTPQLIIFDSDILDDEHLYPVIDQLKEMLPDSILILLLNENDIVRLRTFLRQRNERFLLKPLDEHNFLDIISACLKEITTIALLAALALIFSYVEAIIPYTPGIPGIKLGVANLVTVLALYKLSAKHAAAVNGVRIFFAGLLFSGVFGMLYSLAGATLSLLGMMLLKKTDLFSMAGVSMAGGVLHNIGQVLVAALLIADLRIVYYLPVLLLSGTLSGLAIGVAAQLIAARLPEVR